MCILAVVFNPSPGCRFPVAVVHCREESLSRPTAEVQDDPQSSVYAARDLRSGGTWMAFNAASGKLSVLTNSYGPLASIQTSAKSGDRDTTTTTTGVRKDLQRETVPFLPGSSPSFISRGLLVLRSVDGTVTSVPVPSTSADACSTDMLSTYDGYNLLTINLRQLHAKKENEEENKGNPPLETVAGNCDCFREAAQFTTNRYPFACERLIEEREEVSSCPSSVSEPQGEVPQPVGTRALFQRRDVVSDRSSTAVAGGSGTSIGVSSEVLFSCGISNSYPNNPQEGRVQLLREGLEAICLRSEADDSAAAAEKLSSDILIFLRGGDYAPGNPRGEGARPAVQPKGILVSPPPGVDIRTEPTFATRFHTVVLLEHLPMTADQPLKEDTTHGAPAAPSPPSSSSSSAPSSHYQPRVHYCTREVSWSPVASSATTAHTLSPSAIPTFQEPVRRCFPLE